MIKFLANLFRGLSYVLGITAPPPEQDQRSFVFMWLGIVVFVVAFCVVLFYALSRMMSGPRGSGRAPSLAKRILEKRLLPMTMFAMA